MKNIIIKNKVLLLVVLLFCVACANGCGVDPKEEAAAELKRQAYRKKLESYVSSKILATVDDEFFDYPGFRDWWRFPLVYPYSISMIDVRTDGSLEKIEKGEKVPEGAGSREVSDITHLAFDGQFMLAKVDPDDWGGNKPKAKQHWIVFEFSTGEHVKFSTEEEAIKDAKARGYSGSETLEELIAHYNRTFN